MLAWMKLDKRCLTAGAALLVSASVLAAAAPPEKASDADKAFVAKVSQGGEYEVEAGKVAAARGHEPDIRDLGSMDTHDHMGVNENLHKIATATGVSIAPALNAEFTARLNKLKTVPADQFDAFYISDMKQIHDADGAAFAKEASEGTPAYQGFAHQTQLIVKRHLGAYNAF